MRVVAEAFFPTRFGKFRIYAFRNGGAKEHIAIIRCQHKMHGNMPVRVHSRCLTGDTLTSLRCDCRDQLEASLKYMERKKCGILIYMDQEGRGIGLANKIKAYELQDRGYDTVEANLKLGFREDTRDYRAAASILKHFGINDIALLTNNPKKIDDLEKHGIRIAKRVPLITKTNTYNRKYMDTKKKKMNHLI
ncbi:MAG TPA: GTP cyclohydrolase II [Candidatus Bilamarchaeum sp.]|nr:GTP cyclohydrolase II [Candidatus Bilamarchaeum sp.]